MHAFRWPHTALYWAIVLSGMYTYLRVLGIDLDTLARTVGEILR